jgi:hypothetical protein
MITHSTVQVILIGKMFCTVVLLSCCVCFCAKVTFLLCCVLNKCQFKYLMCKFRVIYLADVSYVSLLMKVK